MSPSRRHECHALAPSYPGTVVLDIGEQTGALVLYTGPDRLGDEIHIGPAGRPDVARTHSAVRERRLPRGLRYCAVYPGLPAGDYTVWTAAGAAATTVSVEGGLVTEATLDAGGAQIRPVRGR